MGHKSRILKLRLRGPVIALVIADVLALAFSILAALLLRFDGATWPDVYNRYVGNHLTSMPFVAAFYIGALAVFRMYKRAWRFTSLDMLWDVIGANTAGVAGMMVIQMMFDGSHFPRSVLVMVWGSAIMLTGGIRVFLRMMSVLHKYSGKEDRPSVRESRRKRVVILGAGADGASILRAIREDPYLEYDVIGFLDEDPNKMGVYISNVRVIGSLEMLKKLADDGTIDEVIVALPEDACEKVREYVLDCRGKRVAVKKVPQLRDTLIGKTAIQMVDFGIEDLLGRAPVSSSVATIGTYIKGKRVLVTGAGGSIGSELCRQIMQMEPAALILLGHGENSIHLVHQELQARYRNLAERLSYVIASVSNKNRIDQVFKQHRPNIVFHAAAHKHVPIMELNEQEAVSNNVLGTHHVADACGRYGVDRMVLISTDKAADPCSIMGATKWLCEEVLRASSHIHQGTSYVAVRFGNVLGSRGSVVPVFKEQIRRGGPVTVTHPDMTRYFMTIPEAVRLVLQAGGVGRSGELYLLDMGNPVRIVDLARDMIRLHGFEPDVDIEIAYTGMRPGEKLHETLTASGEDIHRTNWEGLYHIKRPQYFVTDEVLDALVHLERATSRGSSADVRRLLNQLIPSQCTVPVTELQQELEESLEHEGESPLRYHM